MKTPQDSLPIWGEVLPLLIQTPAILTVAIAQSSYRSITDSHSLGDFTENVFFVLSWMMATYCLPLARLSWSLSQVVDEEFLAEVWLLGLLSLILWPFSWKARDGKHAASVVLINILPNDIPLWVTGTFLLSAWTPLTCLNYLQSLKWLNFPGCWNSFQL